MNSSVKHTSLSSRDTYSKRYEEAHSGAYVAYIRGKRCQSDQSFFYEISAAFQFPDYFGENWNALHDCLSDLEWLCFSKLVIILDNFSQAFPQDDEGRTLLLRSFSIMADYWESEGVPIEVWLNN